MPLLNYISWFPHYLKLEKQEEKKEVSKYAVKPPKDLVSRYEAKLAAKESEGEGLKAKKRKEEEADRIAVIIYTPVSYFTRCYNQ